MWRTTVIERSAARRRAAFLVAVLLAATVLLWLWLRPAAVPESVAGLAIRAPREAQTPRPSVTDASEAATTQAQPAIDGFNVSVRLQYDSTDPLVLSKVREYHEALISGLRAVPKLHLVEGPSVLPSDGPDAFRVTISSLDPLNAQHLQTTYSEWAAIVSVEVLTGEAAGTMYGLGMIGDAWKGAPKQLVTQGPLSGHCAVPTFKPCTPDAIADAHVRALRKHVFPRDGSLERELEAQFLDATKPEPERQRLRNELKGMNLILSDAMVQEALARLARPMDPGNAYAETERLDLLIILAGQRREETVRPLIDLALYDPDVAFRTEALRLLAKDFPDHPAVRATLQNLARDSSDPLRSVAAEMLSRISGA